MNSLNLNSNREKYQAHTEAKKNEKEMKSVTMDGTWNRIFIRQMVR